MTRMQALTSEQATTLIDNVSMTVKAIMSKKPFDSSHDYNHIERVLELANKLTAAESAINPEIKLNPLLITLACTLHDIGDHKYIVNHPLEGSNKIEAPTAESILLTHGAPPTLASVVQLLVTNVSFTNEKKLPDEVAAMVSIHPELAIIQDADRLDAMGAVGVARAFVFNGVRGEPFSKAREVLETHLLPREARIKTALGKEMAKQRCDVIRNFIACWDFELGKY